MTLLSVRFLLIHQSLSECAAGVGRYPAALHQCAMCNVVMPQAETVSFRATRRPAAMTHACCEKTISMDLEEPQSCIHCQPVGK